VAVATGDGHARLGQPKLRPDNMDDPLPAAVQIKEWDAELLAVSGQVDGHLLSHRVGEGTELRGGRNDVVDGRKGPLGVADREPGLAYHLEGLRAGHLVEQVQADEKLRLSRGKRPNSVSAPDLV